MREVLEPLLGWWRAGQPVGMGTVVATFRSAPRPPGASMLVGPDGSAVGSVSGGCVEGAVYELAQEVVADGTPLLHRYGVSDDDAFEVGLVCGGILDVYVERVDPTTFPELGEVADDVAADRPVAVATVVDHVDPGRIGARMIVRPGDAGVPALSGSLGSDRVDAAVADDALGMLAAGHSGVLAYGPDGERRGEGQRVFVWAFAPPPRMIVFGAIDFAAAVARMGGFLGYHVTVCDARPVFATASRFPSADEVVVAWPHVYLRAEAEAGRVDRRTVLCVLTHDPKFDVPLLEVALRLPDVGYVGAMGSRRTHEDRLARLVEAGLTPEELDRMSSPIGLDLGARTPEETAVSIAAEIIATQWGGGGQRLAHTEGRIHHSAVQPSAVHQRRPAQRHRPVTIHSDHPFRDADPDPVRRLRGRLGGAVSLWTSGPPAAGLTVSSLMVAHGDPAHVVGLLDPDSDLAGTLEATGRAVLQLLSWRHRGLAEVFAETAPAPGGKFAQAGFEDTEWGPRLADADTWAGLVVVDAADLGWSRLVTCRVAHLEVADDDQPLLHRRGRFETPGSA